MREGNEQTGNIQQLSTGYLSIASGTTAQRPVSPVDGMVRYNTTIGFFETYRGGFWRSLNDILNQTAGSRLPTTTDDAAAGYSITSLWVWGQRVFSCTSNTTSAATWVEISSFPDGPGIQNNLYYTTVSDGTLTTASTTANVMYAVPFKYTAGTAWNRLGFEVTTATAATNARIGIYTNNGGLPGTLVLDSGNIATTSTGAKEATIAYTNPNDWYWVAMVNSGAIGLRAITPTGGPSYLGRITNTDIMIRRYQATITFGALPSTFPAATASTANCPLVWLRKV